uniref:Uncharacterized protein n=1 Tax=Anguilla anguilla TaxID=7936 RepID=A0A0E9PP33_ANGAN
MERLIGLTREINNVNCVSYLRQSLSKIRRKKLKINVRFQDVFFEAGQFSSASDSLI